MNRIDPSGNFAIIGTGIHLIIAIIGVLAVIGFGYLYWRANYGQKTDVLQEPYLTYIKESAIRYRLKPELVAAIIAAEQEDLNVLDLMDSIGARRGRNTSLGLGQINVNTAIEYNLVGTSDRSEVIRRLRDPRQNIEAVAKYIRIIADMAGPASAAVGVTHWASVDLSKYARDGNEWDYGNEYTVILIGSEYTSIPWDWDSGPPADLAVYEYWGNKVLEKFKEIDNAGLFR